MEEPSLLEALKAGFRDWRAFTRLLAAILAPTPPRERSELSRAPARSEQEALPPVERVESPRPLPWRSLLALALALSGQRLFEPPLRAAWSGIVLYLAALALLIGAHGREEWRLASLPAPRFGTDPLTYRHKPMTLAAIFAMLAFLFLGGNRFTPFNTALWLAAVACFVWAMWWRETEAEPGWQTAWRWMQHRQVHIRLTPSLLLGLAALALVVFFRVYRLNQVPAEAFSDHAEKLLDIYDLTQGQTRIFFPRNTGREAIQMYWTLWVAGLFGSGLSFLSLKIGTVILGLLTLPYLYLLGKEFGSRRVGLLAFVFAGIGYWPNVISRVGLRFPLYPLFAAPTLYYLLRGLRTQRRNDFILAGLFLGLGLHGYTPFRIVPLLVLLVFGLYLLHPHSSRAWPQALFWLALLTTTALLVFLPLLRYMLENPQGFFFRALSRLGNVERPLPGPWWQVFLSNLGNALRMFNWDDGEVWVHSVTHRPALDVVCGALFLMGVVLVLARYLRQRHWPDLILLLSIPILQLPSILSLAYPSENPTLNRTAAALVPVFLIVGLALDGLMTALESLSKSARGRFWAWGVFLLLLLLSAFQNYDLVFNQYRANFNLGAWNTSEMGAVVRGFIQATGSQDTAWTVGYPYWADTRLVMIQAGFPNKDNAIWPDQFQGTLAIQKPKLFLVYREDRASLEALQSLYPNGWLWEYPSKYPHKDFWVFLVLPEVHRP